MVTGELLSDDLLLPDLSEQSGQPGDSSRVLLGLMALSRRALEDSNSGSSLDGVVSRDALRSLLSALHFRDVSTVRHSRRTAQLTVGMAQYLSWEGRELKVLEVAALLHDIGKIGIPDNILFKPGQLSREEAALMALHHNIGIDVLQACRVDPQVLEIVSQANKHYGAGSSGYRIGEDVPQGARILSVADAYDSMATEQVYRQCKPHDEIMQILHGAAGTQFDGNIVAALDRWTQRDGVPFASDRSDVNVRAHMRGPAHLEDAIEASSLCHIFSYLYVLENLYDGFFLVDTDLSFVVWNQGARKLLGADSSSVMPDVWSNQVFEYADEHGNVLHGDDTPLFSTCKSCKATTRQVKIRQSNGEWADVELQSVPLLDENGDLQGVAEIYRDNARTGQHPQEYRDLKMAASRDALTSVANRGELETQLALAITDFNETRDQPPFSVIFLDIDHFKNINDTFGHATGDEVLIEVARLLQHETYSGELVARYGGEEFVVICPDTALDQAVKRAERLRLSICGSRIANLDDQRVSASFGVTEAENGDSVEGILRRADKALYTAKDSGRNQTCSLTTAELMGGDEGSKSEIDDTDPYRFTGSFSACTQADLIVYKLGGFVSDNSAKLLEVTPNRAVIRVGSRGLLPFWGATEEKQPIELQIEFGEDRSSKPGSRRGVSCQVQINILITPVGRIRNPDVFQTRAKNVLKCLKSFFAAGETF